MPEVYGDRLFAFTRSASPKGFPFLTARDQEEMLRYLPRFRRPDEAARPTNLDEAESMVVNALFADPASLAVDVETPSGEVLAVDDPALIRRLAERFGDEETVTLLRSDRAMTDCRPVSLFSIQTVNQLSDEHGAAIDKRRFRANIYLDMESATGFQEDTFVGRALRIGKKVMVSILERDPRCKMVTLDPRTGESDPKVLKTIAQGHDGKAGVYAAVLVEGLVRVGDTVSVL